MLITLRTHFFQSFPPMKDDRATKTQECAKTLRKDNKKILLKKEQTIAIAISF